MKTAIVAVHVDGSYVSSSHMGARNAKRNSILFDKIAVYAKSHVGADVKLYALREMTSIYSPLLGASPVVIPYDEGFDHQGLELKAQLIADAVDCVELCGVSRQCCVKDIAEILTFSGEEYAQDFMNRASRREVQPDHWNPALFARKIQCKILKGLTD